MNTPTGYMDSKRTGGASAPPLTLNRHQLLQKQALI